MSEISARLLAVIAAGALTGLGCGNETSAGAPPSDPSPADGGPPAPSSARAPEIRDAEARRNLSAITEADLASRDVGVRRAAARALARIRDPAARPHLLRQLRDEDELVVAWAAYGLGDVCAGAREKTVEVLATAAVTHAADDSTGELSPQRAIVRALGRCGTDKAEQLLVSWAMRRDGLTRDAIFALGDIARKNKRLREESYVALLQLAEGDATNKPMPAAFYPIGKAEHLRTPSVIERNQKLAAAALARPGPERVHAIRALGRGDEQAVASLGGVLQNEGYTPAEQVEAARNLARFGRPGQEALSEGLEKLALRTDRAALMSGHTGALLTVLETLTIFDKARASLQKLAELPAPADADPPLLRRLSWIRCHAAKLIAERDYHHALLRACDLLAPADLKRAEDPFTSSIGARAIVAAIGVDAAKITGARLAAWRAYALGGDLRARQDALRLIGQHGEITDAPHALAEALAASEPGLVATAAEVVVGHPARVQAEGGVHPAVAEALVSRLSGEGPSGDLEVLGAVIQAAGKLRLDKGKPSLIQHCQSPYAGVRKQAETALAAMMGKDSPSCDTGPPLALPVELERALTGPITVELETDAGKLTLRLLPELAPVATTRVADLAKNGFYDGMVVHRVVPGFVSQFGSPTADGYGGVKGLPSLPCETSPIHFAPGTVGVALAGRDTGSSQLFVTHAATPHLDGEYAQIGTATGPWDSLIDGDVIHKTTVK